MDSDEGCQKMWNRKGAIEWRLRRLLGVGGESPYICTSDEPFLGSFIFSPHGVQGMTTDGRCRVLTVIRELSRVDDDCKVLFVVAVVMIEMQEDSPMDCRYPSACHTLHCYRGRFFR